VFTLCSVFNRGPDPSGGRLSTLIGRGAHAKAPADQQMATAPPRLIKTPGSGKLLLLSQ
jgi:hypothetical protein